MAIQKSSKGKPFSAEFSASCGAWSSDVFRSYPCGQRKKRRAGVRGLFYSRAVCNWVSKRIWKCIRFAYLALWFDEENWRSTNQIRNWKPSLIAHSPKLFLIRFFRNVHLVKRLCMKLWVLMLTERSCFTCKAPNYELLAVVSDFKWYNCKYTHAFV